MEDTDGTVQCFHIRRDGCYIRLNLSNGSFCMDSEASSDEGSENEIPCIKMDHYLIETVEALKRSKRTSRRCLTDIRNVLFVDLVQLEPVKREHEGVTP